MFATGEIYHVFNRATAKQVIFGNFREYTRFLDLVRFYQCERGAKFSFLNRKEREDIISNQKSSPYVEIIAYCIMPNHFHFLLKQVVDEGITKFMRRISDGYSRFYNIINSRVGHLFQGNFKAVRIEDDAQLLHVSRYIHLNPVTGSIVKKITDYPWSSYHEYQPNSTVVPLCAKNLVLGQFKVPARYVEFVLDYADYAKKAKRIEHLTLEEKP